MAALTAIFLAGSAPALARCLGDHDRSGAVSVSELVVAVSSALNGCRRLPRFVDNGDGTLTDNDTGLVWEAKDYQDSVAHPENLHDADNTFAWSGACSLSFLSCQPTAVAAAACVGGVGGSSLGCAACAVDEGVCRIVTPDALTTVWDWLTQLNVGGGFAGHSDWRLPTRQELQSLGAEAATSCAGMDGLPTPCPPIVTSAWSATTVASQPGVAWAVSSNGAASAVFKLTVVDGDAQPVLAVRGGPRRYGQCLGDHDGNGAVSIDELVVSVTNALRGCPPRFTDNNDGTITDSDTGLMWEKKIALDRTPTEDNPHDADNGYQWAGLCSATTPSKGCQLDAASAALCAAGVAGDAIGCDECMGSDGTCMISGITTVWGWLAALNAGTGFAGYTDWRLPTTTELASIVEYDSLVQPAVGPAFAGSRCGAECTALADPECSCTIPFVYWSATSSGDFAGVVDFFEGGARTFLKDDAEEAAHVRAVRGLEPQLSVRSGLARFDP